MCCTFVCQLLCVLDDHKKLSKTCDALTDFTITREELLAQDEAAIDSTTITPPRKKSKQDITPVTKNKKAKVTEKKKLQMAKVEAARARNISYKV